MGTVDTVGDVPLTGTTGKGTEEGLDGGRRLTEMEMAAGSMASVGADPAAAAIASVVDSPASPPSTFFCGIQLQMLWASGQL